MRTSILVGRGAVVRWALVLTAFLFACDARAEEAPPEPPKPASAPKMWTDAEVREVVKAALKEEEDKKKKAEEEKKKQKEAEGYVVGSDGSLKGAVNERGLNFTSENGDFRIKVRTGLQYDAGWFKEPQALRSAAAVPGQGVTVGVGNLDDGTFIRRARIRMDGQVWEQFEFATEFNFENLNAITFDDMWIGMKDLPFLNTIRIGQYKVPMSLEQYTSWWNQPLEERSGLFETFNQDLNPEIFQSNNWMDNRLVFSQAIHRITAFQQFNGAAFGDGQYAYTGRLTGLPIWQDDGRVYLHLGASYQYRSADIARNTAGGALATAPDALTGKSQYIFRFRERPDIRDGIGAQGDQTRFIDTGNIVADHAQQIVTEAAYIFGPLEISGEAEFTFVDNAFFPASNTATSQGNLYFFGGYWQIGCFLTGESRSYEKRFGRFDRQKINSNFFWTRDEDGRLCHGLGAIEAIYRGSYIDLNSKDVHGGRLVEHTFGVQWLLNPMMKMLLNYNIADRMVVAPAASGVVQSIGFQAQLEF